MAKGGAGNIPNIPRPKGGPPPLHPVEVQSPWEGATKDHLSPGLPITSEQRRLLNLLIDSIILSNMPSYTIGGYRNGVGKP